MTPVPRSADNHNHQRRLMNIQPIHQPIVPSTNLSGDSIIANSHDCGGGSKEGQRIDDSSSIQENGTPLNDSSIITSDGAGAEKPDESSSLSSDKKIVSVAATPEARQRPGTHHHNQFRDTTIPSAAVRIVSTQSTLTDRKKLDLIEKLSPVVGSSQGIKASSNNDYNNAVAKEACDSIVSPTTKASGASLFLTPSLISAAVIDSDTSNTRSESEGSDNASQSYATVSTDKVHGIGDGFLAIPDTTIVGSKRKLSPSIPIENFSPTGVTSLNSSTTPLSRRDSLPMGLRNKKMKATDCLLFAATLLEQDAAEGLLAASSRNVSTFGAPPPSTVLPCTTKIPSTTKTKPLKKMVCEKVERSLQEAAEQQKREQQQEEEEDGDAENKPKEADVLCGRGGKVNKHPGNIVYRKVVEYNKSYYQSVHKKHRILVSQSIVRAILNYGGRFMGQKGKEWSPICFKRAVQKTSQALRERSNTSEVLPGVQRLVSVDGVGKK
mmetsp:Transcript_16862/g.38668  ORF Transcript_16862/g.38668 Transcript_16862/m.38668 type:complete len:494 (-) Transcript_16862:237-1718(-)